MAAGAAASGRRAICQRLSTDEFNHELTRMDTNYGRPVTVDLLINDFSHLYSREFV